MQLTFFETPSKFRAWLQKHHRTTDELWVGFYKKATGKPSLTWQEAVDEARFRANRAAWEFFSSQPPGYRRMASWFVLSAKRDETRSRRLDRLIAMSAERRRLIPTRPATVRA